MVLCDNSLRFLHAVLATTKMKRVRQERRETRENVHMRKKIKKAQKKITNICTTHNTSHGRLGT